MTASSDRAVDGGREPLPHPGHRVHVVLGEVANQRPHQRDRLRLARGEEVGHAARLVVDARAAQALPVDLLVRDRLHHVRPGDEHVAGPLGHHREVRDRRRIDRPAGAWSQDQRDLGHDAARQGVAEEDIGIASKADDTFLDAGAARIREADDRAPASMARSITLQIFSACASDSEPPNTVKSCAYAKTSRPSIRPNPVTTPSPRYRCASRPKSLARWVTSASSSAKVFSSKSRSTRSRAVSLPRACCCSIRRSPPPRSASARSCANRACLSAVDTGLLSQYLWAQQGSNLRPAGYEPDALTTELWARRCWMLVDKFEYRRSSLHKDERSETPCG